MTLTQNGGKKITNVKTYYCGYCVNRLHKLFKNMQHETRRFPAAAVLLLHNGDYYLFDTGYSSRVFDYGWRSKVYNWLNPVVCGIHDSLKEQLSNDAIQPSDIKGIILSHLHPDHIGGLPDFPDSKIIVSKNTYLTLESSKLLDLIFMNLIPHDFEKRVEILEFPAKGDIFGDGSLMLKDVSGHTSGQIGMLLPEYNTFYAADSCWGTDLLDKPMRSLAKLLQKNYKQYQKTIAQIKQMQASGTIVITSHEVQKCVKSC